MTETIINKLSQLSNIHVVSRSTVFRYKGTTLDLKAVCKEIGAHSVVVGSVKHFGDRLVVQAELTDVQRNAQLWGERFSGKWENLFDVQEEITTEISGRLEPELTREERRKLENRDTDQLDAYQDICGGDFCRTSVLLQVSDAGRVV